MKNGRTLIYKIIILSILSISLVNCGKEIGRIPFRDINTHEIDFKYSGYNSLRKNETKIEFKKGSRISFWTDINLEYEGDLDLIYNFEVIKNDSIYASGGFTPMRDLNPVMNEIKLTTGNTIKWSYLAKMEGYFNPSTNDSLVISVTLAANPNNKAIIKKADFIIMEK